MQTEFTSTADHLAAHGIKPSVQRMAMLEYLQEHRTHPTADEIYSALLPRIPTLSKTTVYNTLRLFAEQGVATQLTIDERKVCFDADRTPHAHFLCRCCNRVFDLPLRHNDLRSAAELPATFHIEAADLYYRGVCANCAGRQADNVPATTDKLNITT